MLHDLSHLFPAEEVPRDKTDGLGRISELLFELGPCLVLLAGQNGQVMGVDGTGLSLHQTDATEFAADLTTRLRTSGSCIYNYTTHAGQRLAFGLRLHFDTMGSLLGGFVSPAPGASERLESLMPALATAGRLAWSLIDQQRSLHRMEARMRQLRAEHETLRRAHETAMVAVIEEQQKRIAVERSHARRLQKEVEERSSSLQEAREDAEKKAKELLEYSAALEQANLAHEQLSQAADAANRAKSEFLANMSHEIRTPLTAVLGFADLLLGSLENQADLEAASIIKRNGGHLLEVINDILDLSKIEAGKMHVERTACSPCQIVDDVVSLMKVRAEGKGLSLNVRHDRAVSATVQSDPTRLRQILTNLVGNAIKFTEVGSVTVTTRLRTDAGPPTIGFDVSDTGIGMTLEQIGNLFQPFVQGDATMSRRFGGTGLGLMISRRLAGMLGGDISVTSEPGVGSTFSLTVDPGPLDSQPVPAHTTQVDPDGALLRERPAASKIMLPHRILLAEDGPDNQRLISFILRSAGAEVTVAENGQVALEKAIGTQPHRGGEHGGREPPFDLILMDMQMPVLDGYEATRQLRSAGYAGPIIALTAHAMAGDRRRCLEVGCDDYAAKPIQREQLVALVAKHVPAASSKIRAAADEKADHAKTDY
ncbi:MAG: response regulator [Pirellulales bacterium]|nr:response regulator [Pirellulales bacterium]